MRSLGRMGIANPTKMALFMRNERERWGSLICVIGATADWHELRRVLADAERMKRYF